MKIHWLPKEAVRTRAQGRDDSPMAKVSAALNAVGCLVVGLLVLAILAGIFHRLLS